MTITIPKNAVAKPTEAQAKSGNYRKHHISVVGLPITIENPKGSARSGKDADGKAWRCVMPAHYGYFKKSVGADGDAVDCYIGPNTKSGQVYIVNQIDAKTKKFDEHKCMLGYSSRSAALKDYVSAFSDGKGRDRMGGVVEMPVDQFKTWVKSHNTKSPARNAYAEGGIVRPLPKVEGGDVPDTSSVMPYLKSFAAGAVDPVGVTPWMLRTAGYPGYADSLEKTTAAMPLASGAGRGAVVGGIAMRSPVGIAYGAQIGAMLAGMADRASKAEPDGVPANNKHDAGVGWTPFEKKTRDTMAERAMPKSPMSYPDNYQTMNPAFTELFQKWHYAEGGAVSSIDRSQFAGELSDPALRQRLAALAYRETGGQGPQAQQAFLETVFNRAAARGKTIADVISGRDGYYPSVSLNPVAPNKLGGYMPLIDTVASGSNISNGATGNASGTVGFNGGPVTYTVNGERFGREGPDLKWTVPYSSTGGPEANYASGQTQQPEAASPVTSLIQKYTQPNNVSQDFDGNVRWSDGSVQGLFNPSNMR